MDVAAPEELEIPLRTGPVGSLAWRAMPYGAQQGGSERHTQVEYSVDRECEPIICVEFYWQKNAHNSTSEKR